MKPLRGVLALVSLSLTAACGGDGGTCEGTAACGGTIAPGRYKIASYCASSAGPIKTDFCREGISVDTSGITLSGTLTFKANMTYEAAGTIPGSIVEVIPASCLAGGRVPLTCAMLNQSLRLEPGMTGSCTGSGDCTCTITFDMPSMTTGTYSTSGNSLTLDPVGGEGSTGDYCATPNQLSFTVNNAAAMMGMNEVPASHSTMVLTKE